MHRSGDTSVTATDPYVTLGVSRNAADDEIRRAFRKLAKELHPDLHPDDNSAADRFKRVTAAYDIIGDPPKRRQYDNGEIDASGEPRRGFRHPHANAGGGQKKDAYLIDVGVFLGAIMPEHRRNDAGGAVCRRRDDAPASARGNAEIDVSRLVRGCR